MQKSSFTVNRRRAITGLGVGSISALVAAAPAQAVEAQPAGMPGPVGGPAQPAPGNQPQTAPAGINPIASPPQAGYTYKFLTMWDFTPENFVSGRAWSSSGGVYAPSGGGDTLWAMCDLPAGATLGDVEWYVSATESASLLARLWVAGTATLMKIVADGVLAAGPAGVRAARIVAPAASNGPYPHGTSLALGAYTPGDASVAINGVRVGYRMGPTGQVLLPTPQRVYDSRSGAKISGGQTRTHSLAGRLPVGATGAVVNITVTATESVGYLVLYAAGSSVPSSSSINWSATGQTLANSAQTSVSGARSISVTCGGRPTHYIIDLVGYLI